MKILKRIILVVLILFVLLLAGVFIFLKTLDVNRYKTQIVAAANSALNRTVDFKTIDLKPSISQGVRFAINGVTISESSAFGTGDFFSVDEVFVSVNVLSYIMKKEIAVTRVQIKSPRVTIIRDKDGQINAQTIGTPPAENPSQPGTGGSGPSSPAAKPADLPAVFVDTVEMTGGEITVIDRTFDPEMKLSVTQASLMVNGFSLSAPFKVSLGAAVFGQQENIRVEGKVRLDPKTSAVTLSQFSLKTDLDKISFDAIRQLPVIPQNVPFPEVLGGQFTLTVKELAAGPQGLTSVNADVKFENGKIAIKEAAPGVSFAASKINVGVTGFSLNNPFQWNVSAAYLNDQPNITVQGKALFDMMSQSVRLSGVSVTTDLSSYSLDQLKSAVPMLKDQPLPDKLTGNIRLDLNEFSAGPAGLTSLNMNFGLTNGAVSLKDKSGAALSVQGINLALKDFSLNGPFSFSLKAGVMNPVPNVSLDGYGVFNLEKQSVRLRDTTFETDLAGFSLAQIKESAPALKDVPLPDKLAGKCRVSIKDAAAGPAGLESLSMDVSLSGGQVSFKEIAPGVGLDVSQAKLNIKDFSLNGGPFSVQGELAYLSDRPNFSFETKAALNQQTQEIKIDGLNFQTDLSALSLDRLKQSIAALKDAPLPVELKGQASVALSSLTAGPSGLGPVNGTMEFKNGRVVLKELNAPVDPVQAKIQFAGNNVTMEEIVLKLGKGSLSLKGSLTDFVKEQRYQADTKLIDLSLAEIINQKDFAVKVQGVINGELAIQGHGFEPNVMMEALTGQGNLAFKEGRLTDINILALVLDNIKIISNFRQTIESILPPDLKTRLNQKDTVITDATMTIGIENSLVKIKSFNLTADNFLFTGTGQVGFDQRYTFNGIFIIPQDMSQYMAQAAPQLEYLYDEQKRIRFPLLITGKGPNVQFFPDLKDLAANALKNKGREELQKLFNKTFDSGEKAPASGPETPASGGTQPAQGIKQTAPSGETAPPAQPEKAPEQILIEGVLDSIFKKF
ncbi:MAG: AsmA family protein [Candidatus Omnitrophota bacterium]